MSDWTNRYEAEFLEPIAKNLSDTIKRDALAALTWANAGAPLPNFKKVKKTNVGRVDTVFPVLAVLGLSTVPVWADNEKERIGESHQLTVEMALTGDDEEKLTSHCYRYVRAVAHIILGISSDDLFKDMTALANRRVDIELDELNYDTTRKGGTKYVRRPFIDVTIRVMEV
ncbi:MAG TPA: hypothetical protein VJS44_04640 [Pyrinomonadaceae bacterium]|nr:hypothetical protein [Pyrinomonadaceae bacterium]